jgi:hypothetical protein
VPIEIRIDKSTFDRLVQYWTSLPNNFTVPIEKVGNCSALGTIPQNITFNGLDLLLAIGEACSRPQLNFDPAQLFALFKYAGAIARTVGQLRLDAGLQKTDSHKLAVLSDEFGCGMSFLVARQLFGTTYFLDFETAVSNNWLRTTAKKRQRPDFVGQAVGGGSNLVLLEAKGSQSSHVYCKNTQIAKGCQQVKNVKLVSTQFSISKRAVVGLALNYETESSGSRIYVGDPVSAGQKDYTLVNEDETRISDSHYLRLAVLGGDWELASVLSPQPEAVRKTDREPEQRPELNRIDLDRIERNRRSFVGTSVVYLNEGSRLELFVGLDEQVRRRVLDGTPMTHDIQTRSLSRLVKGRAGNVVSAAAGAEDGSILDFRVSIQT